MKEYLQDFKEAMEWTDAIAGGLSNYPLRITPELKIDIHLVVEAIARDLSDFLPHTDVLRTVLQGCP
jgi:hypothetical protein